jgi:outer membrane protein assembly factor BamD
MNRQTLKIVSSLVLLIISLAFVSGCSKRSKLSDDPLDLYNRAEKLYSNGKYSAAIKILDHLTLTHRGSEIQDAAQMLLGKSYLKKRDYISAAAEFRRIIAYYSDSEFAEEAQYMIAESYWKQSPRAELDQDYTLMALGLYQDFLDIYPDSEWSDDAEAGIQKCKDKLAEKEYKNIYIYYKLGDFEAAILYADMAIEMYPDASIKPGILYYKGLSLEKLDRYDEAREIYQQIINEYPKSDEAVKSDERYQNLVIESVKSN